MTEEWSSVELERLRQVENATRDALDEPSSALAAAARRHTRCLDAYRTAKRELDDYLDRMPRGAPDTSERVALRAARGELRNEPESLR